MTDGEILDQLEQWLEATEKRMDLSGDYGWRYSDWVGEILDDLRELRSQQTKEND